MHSIKSWKDAAQLRALAVYVQGKTPKKNILGMNVDRQKFPDGSSAIDADVQCA
jgi:hypothetical protein